MGDVSGTSMRVTGWVSGPNQRGTIDIVWSSIFTIFLCTWTAICLNIPRPSDSKHRHLYTRLKWMLLAILYPELVFAVAIGQYASARRSLKRFHNLGHMNWTLRHGFFADMGGILLQPNDDDPFVVNSYQLFNLVRKNLVEFPAITEEEIWDKSKADTLTRFLTILQAGWLIIQLIGRAILRLPTSTLELSACSIVFCTLGTFLCWLHKPSDVQKGIVLVADFPSNQLLLEAGGIPIQPYRHSYIDAAGKDSFSCIYDIMRFSSKSSTKTDLPLRHFPNDRINSMDRRYAVLILCFNVAYTAFHLIGWYFTFPTTTEALLWKVSSLAAIALGIFSWVLEREKPITADRVKAGTKDRAVAWKVALRITLVFFISLARFYIIIESLIGLREMPVAVYKNFEVADALPHW
ncbi:hypothetical protein F4820DRAFT_431979 [Hypoxylon rubiginosum]|uniref:Uncharacterized protein n=1 Tax=Hypoxylon rubiginosum TaxID=110542 RepID=A0ACB9YS38_9PEZI|nr:hypothetical protein F4820DRAFT_431979 [Hypoxylon rubiginosum]